MECRVFGFLKQKAATRVRVGVSFVDGDAVVAVVRRPDGALPVLERCLRLPRAALPAMLKDAGHAKTPLSVALQPGEYQLAMLEAPDVLPAELRAAVRWKLRDAIDFHVDDAVVDVFDLPAEGRRAQGRMMYAVAARRAAVEQHGRALHGVPGLRVVDVPELCLRNLAALLPAAEHGVALLALDRTAATVVLVRERTLYLARHLDLQASLGPGDPDEAVDAASVALQLQRSLDYYESHYDQPPIAEIAVAPAGPRAAALAEGLAAETGLKVGVFDLAERFDCSSPPAAELQADALYAVGAALRDEKRTL
jgi:MSHA biogenesis protein MshI